MTGKMTLFVTGPTGQLGGEICEQGLRRGFSVVPAGRPGFRITDRENVIEKMRGSGASIVVNTAAYTAVDEAEDDPEEAFRTNRDGPAVLADCCADLKIPLIHISTDYVFDGGKPAPYLETDPVNPINVYGMSKAEGEREIRARLQRHVIVRTSWLYSLQGRNFVKTMLKIGAERGEVRVVTDQTGCPTCASELACSLLAISEQVAAGGARWGTYHLCGDGCTSWYGFAKEIFRIAKPLLKLKVDRVTPVSTAQFPTRAKRPANSVLDCSAIRDAFGISPEPWRKTLDDFIRLLARQEKMTPAEARRRGE